MERLVETHCHLFQSPLAEKLDAALERAASGGVSTVIVPAYDRASWGRVAEILGQHRSSRCALYVAYGIHPWVASRQPLEGLPSWLERPGVVAVGEIGLDSKVDGAELDTQVEVLRRQLEIAVERDLPVILHCRGAFEQLLRLLGELRDQGKVVRGVIHAFTKSIELARRFTDLGLSLGVGGAITRPRARLRATIESIDLEHVVLETDAPSIGLDGVEASDTEPMHVHEIGRRIARIRGQTFTDVARQTTRNAQELFRLQEPAD